MKNLNVISLLLTSLLLGGMALAQGAAQTVPEAPQPQSTAIAGQPIAATGEDSGGKDMISQFGRYPQVHRGPIRSSGGQAHRSGYASTPRPPFSVLGALIGFGVGAAIGAGGSDHSGTTLEGRVIIGGTIFAVIGGAIGGGLPFRHKMRFPGPDRDDDEETNLRHPPKRVREKTEFGAPTPRGSYDASAGLTSPSASNFKPNNRVAAF